MKEIELNQHLAALQEFVGTTWEADRCVARETVSGNAGGVTEVKSTSHFTPDGRMRVTPASTSRMVHGSKVVLD